MKKLISLSALVAAIVVASALVKRLALISALLAMLNVTAKANDIYIAQAASGSANGSSCANAYAYSYFNSGGNWTSGTAGVTKIGPGSTVHVCGAITVGAGQEALIFQGGGTSGSPVTLYFESGASLQAPQWPADGNGGAIDIGSNSYITINGNGGANGAIRGMIEATSNGDSGAACPSGSCSYHGESNGVEAADGASNITIEGLAISDMYVATNPSPGGGTCIYDHGNITNWTITNNVMHDVGWCINLQYDSGTSSGIIISNNEIYNVDHGVALGGPHSGQTLTNVNIYGNSIHDYANWDTANDVWHHDGIHIWGYNDDGSDTITGINIYSNKFGGCVGKNVTSHIFVEGNSGSTSNVKIYNNTLIDTCAGTDYGGLINIDDPGYEIYNNTFMGTSNDTCMGVSNATNVTFANNALSGCGTLIWVDNGGSFASGGLHNNMYGGCSGSNCFAYHGNYGSFSTWQGSTGQDASPSGFISNLNLSPAGVPQTGSAVVGAAANLTSLAITTLDKDIVGNPRPTTGSWTAGAYATSRPGPPAPTNLTGTVVTN